MVGVEYLPHKQEEPLLAKTTRIDTFLSPKLDSQCLLNILTTTTNNLAHLLQTIIHKAFPPDVENEMLNVCFMCQNAIEESFSRLAMHLAFRIVLENSNLCPYAEEEGILAENKFARFSLPHIKVLLEIQAVD